MEVGEGWVRGALTGEPGLRAWQEAGSCLTGPGLQHTSSTHVNPFPLYEAELGLHSQITP